MRSPAYAPSVFRAHARWFTTDHLNAINQLVIQVRALSIALLAVFSSLLLVACVSAAAISFIKRLRKEAAEAMRRDVGEEKVYRIDDCNFFGIASRGLGQVRGNGLLALTDAGLRFRMLLPQRALFISAASIKEISFPRRFLGKSKGGDLLRVDFVNEDGEEDAGAWLVGDPRWWGKAIAALIQGEDPPGRGGCGV
jgi:hypothetical protein